MNYYTYLKTLDTSHFADILIKELYKLAEGSETFSPTVGQLYKQLGQKVQQRYQIEQKKHNGTLEKIGEIYSSYCELWDSGKSQDNTRQAWQRLVHEQLRISMALCLRKIVVGVRQVILFEVQLSLFEIATFHVRDKHVEPKSFIAGILGGGL